MSEKIEICFVCGNPTGKAGRSEDSIYWADSGPWCPECSDTLRDEMSADDGIYDEVSTLRAENEPRGCAMPGCCAAVETIERLKAAIEAGQAVNIRMARELATAEARVLDEMETEHIIALCPDCNAGSRPYRQVDVHYDDAWWKHQVYVSCLASFIWERRYQRGLAEEKSSDE